MMTTRRSRRFQPAILGYDHLESRRMLDASAPPPVDTPPPPPSDPTAPTDTDFDPAVIEIDNEAQALAMLAPAPMVAVIGASSASTSQTLIAVIEAGRVGMNNLIAANIKTMNDDMKVADDTIDKALANRALFDAKTVDGQKNIARLDEDIKFLQKTKANLGIDIFVLGQARDSFNAAVDNLEGAIKFFSFTNTDPAADPAMGMSYYTNDELDFAV